MVLQFRNKDGIYLFEVKGETAVELYDWIERAPEFTSEIMELKSKNKPKQKFKVFKCIRFCGYSINNTVSFILNEDDYVKVR